MIVAVIITLVVLAVVCIGVYAVSTKYEQNPHDIEGRVQDLLQGKYSDKMNRWSARRETTAALARGETVRAVSTEAGGVADMYKQQTQAQENKIRFQNTTERMRGEVELEEQTRQTAIAREENTRKELDLRNQLLELAAQQGMSAEDRSTILKHREMKRIDLEARQVEIQMTLDAADRMEMTVTEQIDKLTATLYKMYTDRKVLETGNDIAKDDKLRRLGKNITVLEKLIDVRQERLLISEGGEGIEGEGEQHSDGRGNYPPEDDED
jgi:hypothetical protein